VVEIVAARASVESATRIVGSGPVTIASVGEAMIGVVADGCGQAGWVAGCGAPDCVRRGRVSACCWAKVSETNNDCASSTVTTLRAKELRILCESDAAQLSGRAYRWPHGTTKDLRARDFAGCSPHLSETCSSHEPGGYVI